MCLVDGYWESKVEVEEILSLFALGWIQNFIQRCPFCATVVAKAIETEKSVWLEVAQKSFGANSALWHALIVKVTFV